MVASPESIKTERDDEHRPGDTDSIVAMDSGPGAARRPGMTLKPLVPS
jgi:hypothetical protein